MNSPLKYLAIILFIALSVAVVRYLDTFYDQADLKNAQRVVFGFKSESLGGMTLLEAMAKNLQLAENKVGCVFHLESASQGTVSVTCQEIGVKETPENPAKQFQWLVHRVSGKVSPLNQNAQALIKNL